MTDGTIGVDIAGAYHGCMDVRRLLIFRTVLRNGSLGAAARELGWTQPAVSQHLAALEKEVGTQLLLRSPHGVSPTEAGQRLSVHAEAIAAQLEAASAEIEDITALRRGSVRFATFPSAAATILPPALVTMRETAPGVDVRFEELEPPEAAQALRDGDLDLALVFRYPDSDIDAEGALEWTPLLEDRVRLVLPADHPRADDPTLTLADLSEELWVAGCTRCRAHLLSSAHQAGFEPRVGHSTDAAHVVLALIRHGGGAALLPAIALEGVSHDGLVVRDIEGVTSRTIGLMNRPGALRIPAVDALQEALRREAESRDASAVLI